MSEGAVEGFQFISESAILQVQRIALIYQYYGGSIHAHDQSAAAGPADSEVDQRFQIWDGDPHSVQYVPGRFDQSNSFADQR